MTAPDEIRSRKCKARSRWGKLWNRNPSSRLHRPCSSCGNESPLREKGSWNAKSRWAFATLLVLYDWSIAHRHWQETNPPQWPTSLLYWSPRVPLCQTHRPHHCRLGKARQNRRRSLVLADGLFPRHQPHTMPFAQWLLAACTSIQCNQRRLHRRGSRYLAIWWGTLRRP